MIPATLVAATVADAPAVSYLLLPHVLTVVVVVGFVVVGWIGTKDKE